MASTNSDPNRDLDSQTTAEPFPAQRALLFVLLALLGGLGLTSWLDNADSATLRGQLWANMSTIEAKRNGYIKRLLAQTGDVLQKDQPLVVLIDDPLDGELKDAALEVTKMQAGLEQVQSTAEVELSWRLKELEAEMLSTKLSAAGYLKEKYAHEFENVAWKDFLERFDGLSSRAEPDENFRSLIYPSSLTADEARVRAILRQEAAQNAAEVNAAQIELCETRLEQLKQIKLALPAKLRRSAGIDVAKAQLDKAKEKLKRLEQEKRQLTLSAPAYGTVGEFQKNVGDHVSAGERIVELFDRDQQFVLVQVPTRFLSEFSTGLAVNVTFSGNQNRRGRVREIPIQAQNRTHRSAGMGEGDSVVLVKIDPVGKLWPDVPIGSTVEVAWDD